MRLAIIILLMKLIVVNVEAQPNTFIRLFYLSVTPGLGTNGMHPGGYSNYFSLHVTLGYSAASYAVELAVISNLNVNETRGFQFAGLTNFTGANAFTGMSFKERDKKIRSGYEANLSGVQWSGLVNGVQNNVFGWQATGGVNVVKGGMIGFQLAGISNVVNKYGLGVQLAGLYNVSVHSMDGVQLSALLNITTGELFGVQIGLFNRTGIIEGKNSFKTGSTTGLQLGLVNRANVMNGFQVGLINIGKRMQGTQIGLINIYTGGKMPETRDGTSLGLINIGATGYIALYASELFLTTFELATGTVKNARRASAHRTIEIQNALIYASNSCAESEEWALGYGIKKLYFSRSNAPGMGKFRYWSFGIDWLHINEERKKITKALNLISRPAIAYGTRLHPKLRSLYVFGALSYNVHLSDLPAQNYKLAIEKSTVINQTKVSMWPGLNIGLHIQ